MCVSSSSPLNIDCILTASCVEPTRCHNGTQAEVDYPQPLESVVEHYIRGFDVSMDDFFLV